MKRDLIFLTTKYPFERGESFIENEIEYLKQNFDNVFVLSKSFSEFQTKKVPNNFKVYHIKKDLRAIYQVLFDRYYILDFIKNFNIKDIKEMIIFQLGTKLLENKLKKIIKENGLKKENIYVYSYWFNHEAYAATMLKRKKIITKFISRAHGFDLYKYRKKQVFKEEILKNADEVLAVSKTSMDYLKREYKFGSISYSYLGTKNRNELKLKNKSNLIISCSNIIPLKRVKLIVESLAILEKKYPNLEWIHFGDGEDMEKIKELAKQKLVKMKYKLEGYIQNSNILKFYERNDILLFIHLSTTEGLPVSMMEVQSFGIPIIATNVGGVSEVVNENTGVLLSANPKLDEIILAIEKFINMPINELKRYQQLSYNYWKEHFNADKNYPEFIESKLLRLEEGIK